MLRWDPKRRPTAVQSLKHSYFRGMQETVINTNVNPILDYEPENRIESPQSIRKKNLIDTPPQESRARSVKKQPPVKDSMDAFDDLLNEIDKVTSGRQRNRNPSSKITKVTFNPNQQANLNARDAKNTSELSTRINQPSSKKKLSEDDPFAHNKFLFRDNTKNEISMQKKKFDDLFNSVTTNESKIMRQPQKVDESFFNDDFLSKSTKRITNLNNDEDHSKTTNTNKAKPKKDDYDDIFSDDLYPKVKQPTKQALPELKNDKLNSKKPRKDDLLEELFGDDMFGAKPKPNSNFNTKPKLSNYEDIFGNNKKQSNPTKQESFFDDFDNPHDTYNTRRSRYVPNSGNKKDSAVFHPNSGKWTQAKPSLVNSGNKGASHANAYVPSFNTNSGNDRGKNRQRRLYK
jgi:hypothetical protein